MLPLLLFNAQYRKIMRKKALFNSLARLYNDRARARKEGCSQTNERTKREIKQNGKDRRIIHAHTDTHTHTYIHKSMCVYMCVSSLVVWIGWRMWVKAGKKRERERIKDSRRSLPSICEKAGCVLCVARSSRTDTRVYQTTTGSYTHTTVHLYLSLPLSLSLSLSLPLALCTQRPKVRWWDWTSSGSRLRLKFIDELARITCLFRHPTLPLPPPPVSRISHCTNNTRAELPSGRLCFVRSFACVHFLPVSTYFIRSYVATRTRESVSGRGGIRGCVFVVCLVLFVGELEFPPAARGGSAMVFLFLMCIWNCVLWKRDESPAVAASGRYRPPAWFPLLTVCTGIADTIVMCSI